MNDLLRQLAEMKAKQQMEQQSLGQQPSLDSASPQEIEASELPSSFPQQEEESEQDLEAASQDTQAPEEVRKAAMLKIRQKYLGQ